MCFNVNAHWRFKLSMNDRPNLFGMIWGPSFVRHDANDEVIDLALNDLKLVAPSDFANTYIDSH